MEIDSARPVDRQHCTGHHGISIGGGAALGKHCGARGTFWNIRAAKPLAYPPADFGPPTMNLVALETTQPSETSPDGKWFKAIPPDAIEPANLRVAQLQRRLSKHPRPARPEPNPCSRN